jgi:hypothetical protein
MIQNNGPLKQIAVYLFLLTGIVLWPEPTLALVEPEDINKLTETAKLTVERFYRESFDLRMQYEYSGGFITPEHRQQLQLMARKASDELAEILTRLKLLKKSIEEYQGQDWESLYGKTGLWRKLGEPVW